MARWTRCTTPCASGCWEAEGRDPQPTAAIIDAQSVKDADTVSLATRGYDAGKKVNGRKRHIVVDTVGLVVELYLDVVERVGREGGVRSRLIKTEAGDGRQEGTRWWMFAGSPSGGTVRGSRSRSISSRVRALVG